MVGRRQQTLAGRGGKPRRRPPEHFEREPEPETFVDPRDWYKGTKGITKDDALAELLGGVNARIRPLVDIEFLRKYLMRYAHALASERWEMLHDISVEAFKEAQNRRTDAPDRSELLARPLTLTSITPRTLLYLEREGIETVQDLLLKRREELMAIEQFGPNCLQECLAALAEMGLQSG